MKKIRFTVLFLLGFFTLLYGDNRYEVKSGIVKYKISTTGKSFGMSIDSSGERIMYFKNWGNLELSDESISQNMMGNIETTRNMMKVDGKYSYSVDFDEKTIIKTDLEEIAKNGKLIDKNILKSMDAKKTGTGKVLGYNCDIWNLMDSNIWIYKGVVLKSESSAMGVKTVETAISAKFNISVSDDKFSLPDYPVKRYKQMIFDETGDNDENSTETPSEDQMQEMMKKFSNMFGN